VIDGPANKYTLRIAYEWCLQHNAPDHVLAAISLAEFNACPHEWKESTMDETGLPARHCRLCGGEERRI